MSNKIKIELEFDLDEMVTVETGKPYFDKETGKIMLSVKASIKPEFSLFIDELSKGLEKANAVMVTR